MIPPGFFEKNTTIVTQKIDLAGMVEDMLLIQPDTKQIAVVFGSSALEKLWSAQCRRDFNRFSDRVEFIWLDDLPLEEMLDRCANLPPRSFIFHGLYLEDSEGISVEKNEAIRRLNEVANAPVTACFESEFGLGPIGGRLFQNLEIGRLAAHTGLRILRGEVATSIPPEVLDPSVPSYDWRQLKRWNIPLSRLPKGSEIRFRQPGFLELYRWPVIGVALFGILQGVLIVGLMVNRSKRLKREAEATMIAHISSRFVNIPADQVDREIFDAQRRICELMNIDMSVLWQWSERGSKSFTATHVYSLEYGPQPPIEMVDENFPWLKEEILAGRVVAHHSLDELPAAAAKDRESARQVGIKSHLTLPLSIGGISPIGIIGFNNTVRERSWPRDLVERLHLVAEIFANALARKMADQKLRESELRQALAVESAEAGLWELNWATQTFWVSEKARTIFHFSASEVVTMENFQKKVHPEDLQIVEDEILRAVTEGERIGIEYRIRPLTGVERWIVSRGQPFFNSAGDPERLVGLSMDVTEDKRAEEKMRQLSLAIEQSPVLVVITDLQGCIVYVNRKFSEVTGYDVAESLGRNPRMLKSGDATSSLYSDLWNTITSGDTWRGEFYNRRKNGELYWERAVISPLIDEAGKITHYVGVKEDITAAKLSEVALRNSEELNRLIFEQAAVGISHVGIDGRWLRVNDRLCEIVGYERDELIGSNFNEVTHPDDRNSDIDQTLQLLSGGHPSYSFEKRYIRKDGATVWVKLNVTLVRSETSAPKHFIIVLEDITEQRHAEKEVQELSQTLALTGRASLLGNLSSALAHELSQPLGAILRNAEAAEMMLKEPVPDWEELKAIIADILLDDQRAGNVIDKLRSLLRRGALDLQPVSLSGLISEVLMLVHSDAMARRVRIVSLVPENLPTVQGDRIHLLQVILNLLVNAMDALNECRDDERVVKICARLVDHSMVELSITDNGPGIPSESLAKLFDPFYTTKTTGMGMGLSISKSLIDAHKGKLWAENIPEGGARFCFTLPATYES